MNPVPNPQEECLRALRNLFQQDPEVFYTPSSVGYEVYAISKLVLVNDLVKVNLEYFVETGEVERVVVSRGFAAREGDTRKKAIYDYRAKGNFQKSL